MVSYSCLMCNQLVLIYSVAPNITSQLTNQTENESAIASYTCQADGEPLPTISWYFNGDPLGPTNSIKYMFTDRPLVTSVMSVLNIRNLESSDAGTYTCNATNVVSSDTSSGILTVNGECTVFKSNIT